MQRKDKPMTLQELLVFLDQFDRLTAENKADLLEFTRLLKEDKKLAEQYAFEKHGYRFKEE